MSEEELLYDCNRSLKVCRVLVQPASRLEKQKIVLCGRDPGQEGGPVYRWRSKHQGIVRNVKLKTGDIITRGSVVLTFSKDCEHLVVLKDLCADCGKDLRNGEQPSNNKVALVHTIPELVIAQKEAVRLGNEDLKVLTAHKKLALLVDLDETLVNTTCELVDPRLPDVHHYRFGNHNCWLHTALRPGVKEFLHDIAKYYQLHIFSFGERQYAHHIARTLDPDGCLFAERIVSRNECISANRKTPNLRSIFPCGDSMVAIIDDRQDVWPNAQNLILVPPFEYFRRSKYEGCTSGLKRTHPLEDDISECMSSMLSKVDRPCYLPRLYNILVELHRRFYQDKSDEHQSVHQILCQMRKEILNGMTVRLSTTLNCRPELSKLINKMGGCLSDDEADVYIGTEFDSLGIQWIFDCAFYWKQPDKEAYRNYFTCAGGDALLR